MEKSKPEPKSISQQLTQRIDARPLGLFGESFVRMAITLMVRYTEIKKEGAHQSPRDPDKIPSYNPDRVCCKARVPLQLWKISS